MGRMVAGAVTAAEGMVLAAAADPSDPGSEVSGVTLVADLGDLLNAGVDVVVDFTVAEASRTNLPVLAAAGVHVVVGTSGLGDDDWTTFGLSSRPATAWWLPTSPSVPFS